MDWSPESCVLWRPFYSTCQKIPVYKCSTTMAVTTWCDFLPLVLRVISDNWVTFYLLFTHSLLHPLSPNNSVLSSCFNRNDLLTFIFSFPPSLPPTSFLPLRVSFLLPHKSSSSSHSPCSPFLFHSPLSYFLLFRLPPLVQPPQLRTLALSYSLRSPVFVSTWGVSFSLRLCFHDLLPVGV